MSPQELKQTGEALIALSEGKPIQAKSVIGSDWSDYNPWDKGSPEPNFDSYVFRVKPGKVKRLIRAEEMPADFGIRMKNYGSLWKKPTSISGKDRTDGGFAIGYLTDEHEPKQEWIQITTAQSLYMIPHTEIWEWSPDRKQINSFFVEEEATGRENKL